MEQLGVSTGDQITAHPAVSWPLWGRLAITVVVGLYVLGHRLTNAGQARVLMAVAWAVGAYALVALAIDDQSKPWVWDPLPSFGLFPNRNHTATILVMGVLAGVTALSSYLRHGHGGWAGLALLPTALSSAVLLGYCESRAGLLLLVGGVVAWVAGQWVGKTLKVSRRSAVVIGLVLVVIGLLFASSDSEVKDRIFKEVPVAPRAPISVTVAGGGAKSGAGTAGTAAKTPASAAVKGVVPAAAPSPASVAESEVDFDLGLERDGRWPIYRDTWNLIRATGWTGVGQGMFEHVMPRYRRFSTSDARALHPESDWWWLAAEGGVPCALALAALVGLVAWGSIRGGIGHRGWTLRWGGLVAAMVVPVHGLGDVPGHRSALALLAVVLVASSFRAEPGMTRPTRRWHRYPLQLVGVMVALAGAWLLWAHWGGRPPLPMVAATEAKKVAWSLYREDEARQQAAKKAAADAAAAAAKAAAAEKQAGGSAAGVVAADAIVAAAAPVEQDLLLRAFQLNEEALRIMPMHAGLQYQRGVVALHFEEWEAVTDQAFAAQRLLDPLIPVVPLNQALAWGTIDEERTVRLWVDAMARATAAVRATPVLPPAAMTVAAVYGRILEQARTEPLMRRALDLASTDHALTLAWCQRAPVAVLEVEMPSLLAIAESEEEKQALQALWEKRKK
jgi:O-antigen ligase